MIYNYQNKNKKFTTLYNIFSRIPIFVSMLSVFTFLYDIGFERQSHYFEALQFIYTCTLVVGAISLVVRYLFKESRPRLKVLPFEILLFVFLTFLAFQQFKLDFLQNVLLFKETFWLYIAIFIVFIREFSAVIINFKRTVINPAQLFVISFLTIIVIGGFLLMLPKATFTEISLIDAMFTSTSAVCVTGLIVVDTGSFFTEFGQILILILIQLGGIGIMTFASYFSYFFRGVSSYENQLVLREISNIEKIGEVFSILKKIILFTFIIEGFGAFLIFQSIDVTVIHSMSDRLFFSVFHSVSGFCNAGFSTLKDSFYKSPFQYNYSLHLIIAMLIILGGLGFPIIFNLLKYLQVKIKSSFLSFLRKKHENYTPWLLNVNTRIVLITSLLLLVFGTLLFYIFEFDNTLSDHNNYGKIVTAFFGAVTTRTAGFNTVDTSALNIPTVLIFIFLMWVGASPGSTGGGIKTSSLALAILNIISIVKGKSRLEIFKREISQISINRSYAIIILSIIVISISIICISFFDPEKGLLNISFECVSAYSTVGLSRGITADLSIASKIILIFTMFIGRISMLTLLVAIFKKVSSERYRFPSENILIK